MTFTKKLLLWYQKNSRDLPWRRTRDPYLIWLSEIILQQTRIEQGLSYYERFAETFPAISDLAHAEEQEVLKLWQGLGYYSRARNMHFTARKIVAELNGNFPDTYEGIRALKGIGDYTAAAIGSIAFNLPVPVVDGNVLRFFSRHFGILEALDTAKAKKAVFARASELIPADDPGAFNQAMMEFGAKYCKPVGPDCGHCVFSKSCFAFTHDMVNQLPVRAKAITQRKRFFHYLVMHSNSGTALAMKKRADKDIWKGLYDFPLIETDRQLSFKELTSLPDWREVTANHPGKGIIKSAVHRHVLTHQLIEARFYEWTTDPGFFPELQWIDTKDLKSIPVPRLIDRYLQKLKEKPEKLPEK